jgi:hypothetical protein
LRLTDRLLDYDNDGAVEVLAIHNGAPVLLRNKAARRNHWLGVKLVVQKSNRDALGARVTYQAENLERSRTKVGGGSFFGVGSPDGVGSLGSRKESTGWKGKWPMPGGTTERFTDLPADR